MKIIGRTVLSVLLVVCLLSVNAMALIPDQTGSEPDVENLSEPTSTRVVPFLILGGAALSETTVNIILAALGITTLLGLLELFLSGGTTGEFYPDDAHMASLISNLVTEYEQMNQQERTRASVYFKARLSNGDRYMIITDRIPITFSAASERLEAGSDVFTVHSEAARLVCLSAGVNIVHHPNPTIIDGASYPHYHPIDIWGNQLAHCWYPN